MRRVWPPNRTAAAAAAVAHEINNMDGARLCKSRRIVWSALGLGADARVRPRAAAHVVLGVTPSPIISFIHSRSASAAEWLKTVIFVRARPAAAAAVLALASGSSESGRTTARPRRRARAIE